MDLPKGVINTDKELWREDLHDPLDIDNYYAPSVFVTTGGGIGISVGGMVYVMPLRDWHGLAVEKFGGVNMLNLKRVE